MLCLEVKVDWMNFCLVNVYMPCREKSESVADFRDALDEVNENFEKYSKTYNVIIMDDINTSSTRGPPFTRDTTL